MTTPEWQPGKLYAPGSLVVPRASALGGPQAIPNGGFDADATGWTLSSSGGTIAWSATGGYTSFGCLRYSSSGGGDSDGFFVSDTLFPVSPGQSITASAMFKLETGPGGFGATLSFSWFDADDNLIGASVPPESSVIRKVNGSGWRKQTISFSAPSGARKVRIQGGFDKTTAAGDVVGYVDDVTWNYVAPSPIAGLMFKATQAAAGYSATTEPAWPTTVGATVTDNEVVWEGVSMSRIVWRAEPIMLSGDTEPTWPDNIGDSVADNTITWVASNPATTDPNCPQSKIVAIAKFKIYAGAGDIVRYTATLAPQDWTTEKDAGYLGTGLQQNGANYVALLNLYRANLVVMNATTFQQWQIDPDPALMDLLDTMDGIGSIWHLAAQPVANDLFYLSNRGVRTIGMSGTSNNLKAGDIGLPVDDLVRELVNGLTAANEAANNENEQPLGLYLPSMGQYWLAFNRGLKSSDSQPGGARDVCPYIDEQASSGSPRFAEVMVYTLNQVGQVGAWSRYIFPFTIDAWAQEGDDLYVRDGDTVYRVSEDIGPRDRLVESISGDTWDSFDAIIQWPWLDMGMPGADKQMESFDLVGYGSAKLEFGYDQTEPGYFTAPYAVSPDTLRGTTVPMPLTAPSYSVRIRYPGWVQSPSAGTLSNQTWGFNAMKINFT